MDRRSFLGTTGTLALTSLFAVQCKTKDLATSAGLDNIGIQLYTVRDAMAAQVCEHAAMIGQKYLICGWLAPEERATLDDYKAIAELFNKCGEVSQKYGIKTGFHNHDFEFETIDGVTPYDLLLSETDADKVCFELDHYWTRKAGVDGLPRSTCGA